MTIKANRHFREFTITPDDKASKNAGLPMMKKEIENRLQEITDQYGYSRGTFSTNNPPSNTYHWR